MRRFEYATLTIQPLPHAPGVTDKSLLERMLNEWGLQGWELVSLMDTNSTLGMTREVVAVLKRELWPDDSSERPD